jgi:hypothetical protein
VVEPSDRSVLLDLVKPPEHSDACRRIGQDTGLVLVTTGNSALTYLTDSEVHPTDRGLRPSLASRSGEVLYHSSPHEWWVAIGSRQIVTPRNLDEISRCHPLQNSYFATAAGASFCNYRFLGRSGEEDCLVAVGASCRTRARNRCARRQAKDTDSLSCSRLRVPAFRSRVGAFSGRGQSGCNRRGPSRTRSAAS